MSLNKFTSAFKHIGVLGFRLASITAFSLVGIISSSLSVSHAAEVNALDHQQKIHIRTLAASCAACHGTQGNSHSTTPVLAGLDPTHFSTQMLAFKNDERASTVMHHHAKGLNTEEIYLLANYFSQQKRMTILPLKPQALKATNE